MPVFSSPADITWEDYARSAQGQGASELDTLMAANAGKFVCELYRDNPPALKGTIFDYSPAGIIRDVLLDKLCRPHGLLPPAPSSQYQGGQCDSVGYEVRVNYTESYNSNDQILQRTQQATTSVWGAVESVIMDGSNLCINGSLAVKGFGWISITCRGGYNQPVSDRQIVRLAQALGNINCLMEIQNVQLTRIGGAADVCGNPKPYYPPKVSPVTNYNNTINITNNADVNFNAPITIVPTLIAPVGVVVKPELNVDVGGLRLTFGTDGIRYENQNPLPPGSDLVGDPRTVINKTYNNTNNQTTGTGTDLTTVLDKLKDIKDELDKCCDRLAPFPEPSTDEYDVQLLHEGTGGIFNLPSRTFTVTVEIITNPGKLKTIEPTSGERVLFCGWAWFHSQGGLCERMPLDADKKAFKPPERAENKITVSCYAGYTCRVRAWYAKANA